MIKEKYNVDRYNNIWFQVIFQQSWQATTYTMEFKVKLVFGNIYQNQVLKRI